MEFKLSEFEIYEIDGLAYFRYTIETEGRTLEDSERLRVENPEDILMLEALETFINTKRG